MECRCTRRKRASVRIYDHGGRVVYQYAGEPVPPCPGRPEEKKP